jgi:hypothetical protein
VDSPVLLKLVQPLCVTDELQSSAVRNVNTALKAGRTVFHCLPKWVSNKKHVACVCCLWYNSNKFHCAVKMLIDVQIIENSFVESRESDAGLVTMEINIK